jgi:hypothetical protein
MRAMGNAGMELILLVYVDDTTFFETHNAQMEPMMHKWNLSYSLGTEVSVRNPRCTDVTDIAFM